VLGEIFLNLIFNPTALILRLGASPRRDEVVGIEKEVLLSLVKWAIVKYPVINTPVVACWHFCQSSHIGKLQQ
jgi:hypothetical protein